MPMALALNLNSFVSEELRASLASPALGARPVVAEISEFGDKAIFFGVSSRMANVGHLLSVEVRLKDTLGDESVVFEGSGKVTEFNEVAPGSFQLKLKLLTYDHQRWNRLRDRTVNIQRSINDFLMNNKC
jgi:hypothetical protein